MTATITLRASVTICIIIIITAIASAPSPVSADSASGDDVILSLQDGNPTISNGLLTVTFNADHGNITHMFSTLLPGVDIFGNNGDARMDRETGGVGYGERDPHGMILTVHINTTELIYISYHDPPDNPNIPYWHWSYHYVMQRGLSGIYIWVTLTHDEDAPPEHYGQYRWCCRLNAGTPPLYNDAPFDTVQVADDVVRLQPTKLAAIQGTTISPSEAEIVVLPDGRTVIEHKYDYCQDSYEHQVFGWFNSSANVGFWTLSPVYSYHNGGPDSQDLNSYGPTSFTGNFFAHIQSLAGGHYGAGDEAVVGKWKKIYGPFLTYMNKGESPEELWTDAKRQYRLEEAKWPYSFVPDEDYAAANRANIIGTLVLNDMPDPRAPPPRMHALVFLTAPTTPEVPYTDQSLGYHYWAYTDENGQFNVSHVVSGTYEVHAWLNGVYGEFICKQILNVTGAVGKNIDIGKLTWTPERTSLTVWEIGYADRTAKEYRHGDFYRYTGLYDLFDKDFPNSVQYYINTTWRQSPSQWRSAWNYAHVPMNNTYRPWNIYFDVPNLLLSNSASKLAYLRIAFAGVVHCQLSLYLNNNTLPSITDLNENDMSVYRNGIHGIYQTRTVTFDASLLKAKGNHLVLVNLCRARFDGIMYDYLRLEIDGWKPPISTIVSDV